MIRCPRSHNSEGFTLVELLAVIAIVAILASLAGMALREVLSGNDMTRAEQIVTQQIAFARQNAIALNRRVEVRFYRFDDPELAGSEDLFRAVQVFVIDEGNAAKPVGKVSKLPGTLAINSNAQASPLLDRNDKVFDPDDDPKVPIPGIGTEYIARAFQFRPDGSTNLNSVGNWFLTLVSSVPPGHTDSATLPDNFATVQVDPANGTVRSYRP